jgi:polysaccharide biosynthesis transport protein
MPAEVVAGAFEHGEGVATAVQPRALGSVSVLPSGGTVANPPALLAGRGMPRLLRSVAEDFDYVLVDAPPPLRVSDVLPLMAMVDAIVIVTRVGHTGENSAQRLADLLARAPHAPVIGIVANDLSSAEIEGFGFSSAYYDQRGRHS